MSSYPASLPNAIGQKSKEAKKHDQPQAGRRKMRMLYRAQVWPVLVLILSDTAVMTML